MSDQPPATAAGQVYCLLSEVYSEASRQLKREGEKGHRGKVLSFRLISQITHTDPKALYRLSADDLTEYDGVVLAKLCMFFDLQRVGDLLQFVPPGHSKMLPTDLHVRIAQGAFPVVSKRDPIARVQAYGRIECLLKERMNEWELANTGKSLAEQNWTELTEVWAEMVRRDAKEKWGITIHLIPHTISSWANNGIFVYNRLLLTIWCAFFGIGMDQFLRYTPPAAEGAAAFLPSSAEQVSEG